MDANGAPRFPPLGDRAVVYTTGFEPIIVIEVTPTIRTLLEETREVTVHVKCVLDPAIPPGARRSPIQRPKHCSTLVALHSLWARNEAVPAHA